MLELCPLKKKKGLDSLGLAQAKLGEKNLIRYSLAPAQTFRIGLCLKAAVKILGLTKLMETFQVAKSMGKRYIDLSLVVSQGSNCLMQPSESGEVYERHSIVAHLEI